jgi:hypothetical protein
MTKTFVSMVIITIILVWSWPPRAIEGIDDAGEWTAPTSLSSGVVGPSLLPHIAHDSTGRLHVVWVEATFVDRGVADALYYSRFDGTDWSFPVDVLVSPDRSRLTTGELVTLAADQLALLWVGAGELQLSVADAKDAHRANAWQTMTLFPGLPVGDGFMVYLPPSTLYVVFSDVTGEDVLFTFSSDLGDSWSEPLTVWHSASVDYAASDARACTDVTGRLVHLVWHENARELDWHPNGIWYARSSDGGHKWSEPSFLPNQGSSPNCAYDGAGRLHMLWNNAVGSIDGRYHRLSTDEGATWTTPAAVFPGLSGRTRAPAFGLDSSGELFVLTGASYEGVTRMYASHWEGGRWSSPELISADLPSNESPDLVVTSGNQLNAVWHYGEEDLSRIWFATGRTDAPTVTFHSDPPPISSPTPRSSEMATSVAGTTSLEPGRQSSPSLDTLHAGSNVTIQPVIINFLVTLGLLIVVVAWRMTRSKRLR